MEIDKQICIKIDDTVIELSYYDYLLLIEAVKEYRELLLTMRDAPFPEMFKVTSLQRGVTGLFNERIGFYGKLYDKMKFGIKR